MQSKFLYSFLLLITTVFSQLSAQPAKDFINVSSGVKYQYIMTYDVNRLNRILTTEAAKFSEYKQTYPPATYGVKLYRVIYNSVIPEFNNRPTIASGLIAIPDNAKDKMPVVSYQHGTVFGKTDVPSFPEESMETRLMVAQFASQGYIVVAADYFGMGQSTEPDAYQIKASTQQACLDMLMASKDVCKALKVQQGPLFLSGWSMGAWSTLLFLHKLESLNIPVKAVAAACTPTDIFGLVNRWIHAPEKIDAIWLPGILAIQFNSYEVYYKLPGLAHSAIKPEYQQAALDYYQKKINFNEFYSKTPHNVIDFLKEDFIAASSNGDSRYCQIINDNNSYRWRSVTPLNLYYGDVDEAVPQYIATLPVGYQQLMGGGSTLAISAGKLADHRGTFKFAVQHQKKWFDDMLK